MNSISAGYCEAWDALDMIVSLSKQCLWSAYPTAPESIVSNKTGNDSSSLNCDRIALLVVDVTPPSILSHGIPRWVSNMPRISKVVRHDEKMMLRFRALAS